jgi:hypothetical protein
VALRARRGSVSAGSDRGRARRVGRNGRRGCGAQICLPASFASARKGRRQGAARRHLQPAPQTLPWAAPQPPVLPDTARGWASTRRWCHAVPNEPTERRAPRYRQAPPAPAARCRGVARLGLLRQCGLVGRQRARLRLHAAQRACQQKSRRRVCSSLPWKTAAARFAPSFYARWAAAPASCDARPRGCALPTR